MAIMKKLILKIGGGKFALFKSINAKNGLIGHEIGQILVDGIWITVDNSAVDIINENYIN